jgi:hypothetical protein
MKKSLFLMVILTVYTNAPAFSNEKRAYCKSTLNTNGGNTYVCDR